MEGEEVLILLFTMPCFLFLLGLSINVLLFSEQNDRLCFIISIHELRNSDLGVVKSLSY